MQSQFDAETVNNTALMRENANYLELRHEIERLRIDNHDNSAIEGDDLVRVCLKADGEDNRNPRAFLATRSPLDDSVAKLNSLIEELAISGIEKTRRKDRGNVSDVGWADDRPSNNSFGKISDRISGSFKEEDVAPVTRDKSEPAKLDQGRKMLQLCEKYWIKRKTKRNLVKIWPVQRIR
jgi:hypothetical protein